MKTIYIFLLAVIVSGLDLQAQNLILNPGCDDTLVDGNIPHWQEIIGNNWTQRIASPDPQGGNSYFFPGVAATAELAQVIDIADDSLEIDNGTKYYYFTGYVRAYAQSPPDESNIFLQFRDEGEALLTSFNFGPYTQTQIWLRIDSALSAPPGARKIDIRLHSVRHNGSNNDGYYDELYLGNSPLVGIPEIKQHANFTIYPNPSDGSITLALPGLFPGSELTILNAEGQQLVRREITEHFTVINISTLPPGIYLVKLQHEKMVEVKKMIKK
ncbi:MAG: T9SS type A sorting domain-containing protein [Lentimicrobium sp.]|nr:T9SS type A sorting domain-containing protein [Lentimicrobium sp.]